MEFRVSLQLIKILLNGPREIVLVENLENKSPWDMISRYQEKDEFIFFSLRTDIIGYDFRQYR